jgi:uncharacterized protein YndB with AHSA1/START domain
MRILGWILGVMVVTIGLITVFGFLSPREIRAENSIEIEAPPEAIFVCLTDLELWVEWEPWAEFDPGRTVRFGEIRRGPGASFTWRGSKTGEGLMEIVEVVAPSRMEYREVHQGDEAGATRGVIELDRLGPQRTRVHWVWEADLGDNPISRVLGSLLRGGVEKGQRQGLENLRRFAESRLPGADPAAAAGG